MISSRTRARSWYAKCGVAGPTSSSIASFVGSATRGSLTRITRIGHIPMGSVEAMRRLSKADVMLLVTVCLWGFNFTVTKYVLTHGFGPLAYSSIRYGGAALLFSSLTYGMEGTLRVDRSRLPLLVLAGV